MSYKVQKDLWVGERGSRKLAKTVRLTIGEVGKISVKEARRQALDAISQIGEGIDPNGTYYEAGAPQGDREVWTVRRMYDEYMADMRAREL